MSLARLFFGITVLWYYCSLVIKSTKALRAEFST